MGMPSHIYIKQTVGKGKHQYDQLKLLGRLYCDGQQPKSGQGARQSGNISSGAVVSTTVIRKLVPIAIVIRGSKLTSARMAISPSANSMRLKAAFACAGNGPPGKTWYWPVTAKLVDKQKGENG